jgi:DNA repair protein Swi5/Sae3
MATTSHKSPSSDTPPPSPTQETEKEETNPKILALQAKLATLTSTLDTLQQDRATLALNAKLPSGLPMPTYATPEETLSHALKASNTVIKAHIHQLHAYNEIKDIGQGLMGLIADKRGCRIMAVMEDFGVEEKD